MGIPIQPGESVASLATVGSALSSALLTLAQGAPLESVLAALVLRVEQCMAGGTCSVFQVDQSGALCAGVTATLAPGAMKALEGTGVTTAGLAEVTEIGTHPRWAKSRHALLAEGYQSCWSTPVLSADRELVGVLLVYYRKPHTLLPSERQVVDMAANLAALAIERERLRAFQSRPMQALLQHTSEGVITVGPEGQIQTANSAAMRLLTLTPPVEGKRLPDAGVPRDLSEPLLRVATGEQARDRAVAAVGSAHVELVVSPLETALGRRYGALGVLHDVTRQARLRQMQEAFVANVSHELRAPLAALSAAVEALHDGLIPEEQRPRFLKALLGEILRMRKLGNKLLALSKLDAAGADIVAEDWALQPLLDDVQQLWQERCRAAGLTLSVSSSDARVRASYDHVQEVLANLLDNAVKFTPPGGQILVRVEVLARFVQILVIDTGVGVRASPPELVWERFYMGDEARTRGVHQGSGLGLSIVRRVVEAMGGKVGLDPNPEGGSIFHFTLPLAATQ